jgi:SpoVK/Ycf46/Vps4 family AAA+-type ATPase
MASTMMKNIKDIFGKIQPTLPYLVIVGAMSNTTLPFLLLIPVILELIEWGWNAYQNRLNQYTLEVFEKDHIGDKNYFHTYVTFFLEYHNLLLKANKIAVKGSVCNTNKKINLGGITWNTVNPFIEASSGVVIPYKNDKFDVTISIIDLSDDKATKNKYVISSKNRTHIDAFIESVNSLQEEYVKRFYSYDKEPTHYQYTKTDFTANIINVKKTFQNVFLDRLIKNQLKSQLDYFINNKKDYDDLGNAYRTGYLLHGTPGNGKSSLIYAIANEYHRDIYTVNLHLSGEEFKTQIKKIKANSVVIFEDIDTYVITHNRDEKQEEEKYSITLGDILEILDGYCYLNGCIIIMTTNHLEKLDPALIRPGRIDHKIELTNASPEQIREIINYFFHRDFNESTSVNVSIAELINTIIMPNRDRYELVRDFLIRGNKFK